MTYLEDEVADQRLRRAAREIQRQHPRWLVMYGPYSRRIWAYPRFGVPAGTLASGCDPGELDARMRAAEITHLRQVP